MHWHLANPLLICSLRKFNCNIIKRKETSMAPFVEPVFELSLHFKGLSDSQDYIFLLWTKLL